jgi:hypothetical protein
MSLQKIFGVTLVVCLTAASAAQADQDRRRGRRGRDDARVVVRPRIVVAPPVVHRRGGARRAQYARGWPYRSYGRGWYAPVHRPGIGFGIYIGSPGRYYAPYRRYSYAPPTYGYAAPIYGYPYAGPYAYNDPYPAHGAIYAAPPPDAYYGGVRLDVVPSDAAVHVDGYYAGVVDDFDGAWQRVALAPGPHRFEIAAPGYEPVTFDVNVQPNQTVRYRANLLPLRP